MNDQRAGFFRPVPVIVRWTLARRVEVTRRDKYFAFGPRTTADGAPKRSLLARETTVRLTSGLLFPALSNARILRWARPLTVMPFRYWLPWSIVGAVPSLVQRTESRPETASEADSVTVTVFAYGFLLQAPPLHWTASAGGVASPTSRNEAVPELRPAAFVAVTLKGAVCTLPALLNA